jgi:hypothetical protein
LHTLPVTPIQFAGFKAALIVPWNALTMRFSGLSTRGSTTYISLRGTAALAAASFCAQMRLCIYARVRVSKYVFVRVRVFGMHVVHIKLVLKKRRKQMMIFFFDSVRRTVHGG